MVLDVGTLFPVRTSLPPHAGPFLLRLLPLFFLPPSSIPSPSLGTSFLLRSLTWELLRAYYGLSHAPKTPCKDGPHFLVAEQVLL